MNNKEFWFIVGSQFLYGEEVLQITKDTTVESLEQQLFLNDLAWKLK